MSKPKLTAVPGDKVSKTEEEIAAERHQLMLESIGRLDFVKKPVKKPNFPDASKQPEKVSAFRKRLNELQENTPDDRPVKKTFWQRLRNK